MLMEWKLVRSKVRKSDGARTWEDSTRAGAMNGVNMKSRFYGFFNCQLTLITYNFLDTLFKRCNYFFEIDVLEREVVNAR